MASHPESAAPSRIPVPVLLRSNGPMPYGYHNTFHIHAQDAHPPTYNEAKLLPISNLPSIPQAEEPILPPYSCSVYKSGLVGLQLEFQDPFANVHAERFWQNVYAVLRGTQLSIHCLKSSFRSKTAVPKPGKRLASFSLQHAEVGLAVDIRSGDKIPKNPWLNLLSATMMEKLQRTKPHLFENPKEWILRLRLESFQLLLCFDTEEIMLDWCEKFCEGIDIAPPIEDRTEPRYRSLPRRSRRQRQLENHLQAEGDAYLLTTLGSQLVQQQESIMREYYPHLARDAGEQQHAQCPRHETAATVPERGANSGDADMDEFDAADVTEGPVTHTLSGAPMSPTTSRSASDASAEPYDPKTSRRNSGPSPESALRYRRRCMPVMYKLSPRSSDVVFCKGMRFRIDHRRSILKPFELSPPRYPRGSKSRGDKASSAAADNETDASSSPNEPPASWHNPVVRLVHSDDDGGLAAGMSSSESGQADETDGGSVHSIAGMSTSMGIEPVSTRGSMLGSTRTRDSITEGAPSPGALMMLPYKEKAVPLLDRRRVSRADEDAAAAAYAFAGLVL
jgi:hypothetical protein